MGKVRLLKHTWCRKKISERGTSYKPQEEAIRERTDPSHMLVKSETARNGFLFTTIPREIFLTWLEGDFGLQEIIEPHKPAKVYFDCDYTYGEENTPPPTLTNILIFLKSVFPHGDFQVSGSETDKKLSYHICVNNYITRNQEERTYLKYLCQKFPEYYLDPLVYTKNRCMKCVNQSKTKDKGQRVQTILEGFSQDLRHHIITEFFPDTVFYAIDEHDFTQYMPKEKAFTSKHGLSNKFNWKDLPIIDSSDIPTLNHNKSIYDLDEEKDYKSILWAIPNPPFTAGKNKRHNHNTIWNIMRWAKNHNLSLGDFINWVKQRDGNDTEPYLYQWNHLNESNYGFVPTCALKPIFKKYNKGILDQKAKSMVQFKDLNNIKPDVEIFSQWLTANDLNQPSKYVLLFVGMGGNKTGSIITHIKKHPDKSWLWITPRITLGANTKGRMLDEGNPCGYYKDFHGKQGSKIRDCKNLIIQLQSLHRIQSCSYDYIIIDEVESVLQAWAGGAVNTHGKNGMNIQANWDTFKALLQGAKKCFFLDAFLTKRTTQLITDIEAEVPAHAKKEWFKGEGKIYTVISRHESVPLDKREMVVMNGYDSLLIKLITKIRQGKKVYVYYPYGEKGGKNADKLKNKLDDEATATATAGYYPSMVQFSKLIQQRAGLDENDIKTYWKNTSDDDIKQLRNATDAWKNVKVVIANSKITVGVNFDCIAESFDDVFLFWVKWVQPRDIVQSSYRARHLRGRIYTAKMATFNGMGGFNKANKIDQKDTAYQNLFNSLRIEDYAKHWETFLWFCEKAGYKLVKDKEEDTTKPVLADAEEDADAVAEETEHWNISYDSIEDISEEEFESIYFKQVCGKASYDDKLRLDKYFFTALFKPETPKDIIHKLYGSKQLTLKIADVLKSPYHVISRVLNENGWTAPIPQHAIKDVKLSPELREEIENTYKFKSYLRDSKDGNLVHRLLESYFGQKIFTREEFLKGARNNRERVWKSDEAPIWEDWAKCLEYLHLN